jgi:hypothetical protein
VAEPFCPERDFHGGKIEKRVQGVKDSRVRVEMTTVEAGIREDKGIVMVSLSNHETLLSRG